MIATGFDSAYLHEQANAILGQSSTPTESVTEAVRDDVVAAMNLELDQTESAEEFASEPQEDIWNQPEDDEADTPAFLRRRKRNKDKSDS